MPRREASALGTSVNPDSACSRIFLPAGLPQSQSASCRSHSIVRAPLPKVPEPVSAALSSPPPAPAPAMRPTPLPEPLPLATSGSSFLLSSVAPTSPAVPNRAGRSFLQTDHRASRFHGPDLCVAGVPWGTILRRKLLSVTPNSTRLDVLNLTFARVGDFTVNWAFLFLRIAIALSILTLLFLSQRFWYRSLWRMTSNWGQVWLRVAARLAYVSILLVVIATLIEAISLGRGRIIPRASMIGVLTGLWFFSALFSYLAV